MSEWGERALLAEIVEILERIQCELREPQRVEIVIKIELVQPRHTYHPTVGGTIGVK